MNVLGANVDLHRAIGRHNIRVGIDAQYNTLKSTANEENIVDGTSEPLDTRYPDGDNNMSNAALYWSHTMSITDKIVQ